MATVKKFVVCAFALLLSIGSVGLAGAASPASPAASPAATPAARAKEWLGRIQTGNIDRSQLTPALSKSFTAALVGQLSEKIGPLGSPLSMVEVEKHVDAKDRAYVYKVEFANDTTLYFVIAFDVASNRISGLRFTNAE